MAWVSIDENLCDCCGLCLAICGRGLFEEKGGTMVALGVQENCNLCGHCLAICPNQAISHQGFDLANFPPCPEEGKIATQDFLDFIRARRSHRNFLDKPVPREALEFLVEVCRYAPTGSNSQSVEIQVVTDPARIKKISGLAVDFYRLQAQETRRRLAEAGAKGEVVSPELAYAEKRLGMMDRHQAMWAQGRDPILRAAPAAMLFHSPVLTSCPKDNCVIAAHTVTLMARTLGLESCYIALLEWAAAGHPPVMEELALPAGNKLFCVLILGYPKYRFLRGVDRRPIKTEWR